MIKNIHITPDETYFNIAQAAKMIGVTTTTIRNWEKNDLISTKRAKNGYRIFSLHDIDILRKIGQLSKQGNRIETIRALNYPNNLTISKHTKPIISKTLLGDKWKNHRIKLGLSIEQVATKTGISPSYLHKIENAQTKSVSFEILQKLAAFYNENILSYYDKHAVTISPLVKKDAGDIVNINIPGVLLQSITRTPNNQLTSMIYTITPGCGRMEPSVHNGEELVYIITGTIQFFLEEQLYTLVEGDSLHFKSQTKHKWLNVGETDAKLLWVYTPTPTPVATD